MTTRLIFDIFLYFSEALVFIYYAQSFFEKKYKDVVIYHGCFAGFAALFFIYRLGIINLNLVSCILIYFLLFVILFKVKPLHAIFHSVGLTTLLTITELIVISLISVIFNQPADVYKYNFNAYVTIVVLDKLFYYVVLVLIARIFGRKYKETAGNSFFWALMIIPITSMAVTLIFNQICVNYDLSEKYITAYVVSSVFLLLANIIIFLVYDYSLKNADELNSLRIVNQKEEIDKTYMQILEKNNNDLHILTHDIKNHLELIGGITDNEQVASYVKEMYGSVEKLGYAGMSNNRMLDVIINKYMTLCENKNLDITFNVKTANLSFMNDFDLSTILNNLLDNAVRSAEDSVKKKIDVTIYQKNNAFQVLSIKNSCDKLPESKNRLLITTKKNKTGHGYGTKSVIKTAEKYNGVFEWEYNDKTHMFEAIVVFQNKAGAN